VSELASLPQQTQERVKGSWNDAIVLRCVFEVASGARLWRAGCSRAWKSGL